MDITSYLLGKNSSGGGTKQEFTIKSGTSSAAGFHKVIEQIDELTVTSSDCAYMFYQYRGSTIPKLKTTEKLTSLSNCFNYVSVVNVLDLSYLDTSSVTNMGYTFANMSKLAVLDISSWDFSSVTSYASVFKDTGSTCTTSKGAYASGIPYVYVKDATAQAWVIDKNSNWTTANVVIKQ